MEYRALGDVLVPLVTPFHKDESVNFDCLAELAHWILDTGRGDTLVVTGTTGDFPLMTDDERVQAWKVVKDAAGGRAAVMAGTGAASTRDTIRLTAEAERIGVDLAMIVAPYYQKPSPDGVYQHYVDVAESTGLPLMIYNIPLFTGVNVDAETVKRLMDVPNIVAVKEEAGINPVQSTELLLNAHGRDDFVVIDGDDMMAFPVIAQGAVGVVSGGAQIVGAMMKKMVRALKEGRLAEATELHLDMFPLFLAFGGDGRVNPIPGVRRGIEMCGIPVGNSRRPLAPFSEAETAKLRAVIEGLGVIES